MSQYCKNSSQELFALFGLTLRVMIDLEGPLRKFSSFTDRGSSHRRKSAAFINFIWFGYIARQCEGGAILLVQLFSTCLRCGLEGGGSAPCGLTTDFHQRVHAVDWRRPLSCVNSVMMVFSAQLAQGGGTRTPPFILSTPSLDLRRPIPPSPQQDQRYTCSYLYFPMQPLLSGP